MSKKSKNNRDSGHGKRRGHSQDNHQNHSRVDPNDTLVGVLKKSAKGDWELEPTNRKYGRTFKVPYRELKQLGAQEGDVITAEILPDGNRAAAKLIIGREDDPKILSLIGIHEKSLRAEFSKAAKGEAQGLTVPELGNREDLRKIPLVTIDGPDARDFDDAVFAEKTEEGWHIIVAIADVEHYVKAGSDLDKEALARGNSTYFPDRVIPMLPEELSNGLCSLRPHEERAVMAMHMWIDDEGTLLRKEVNKALIESKARLTYEQVQAARDGQTDATTAPLMQDVIEPLYEVYDILADARKRRGTLDLEMGERKVIVNDNNEMTGVEIKERLDSHRLIEEFMVLANVAAAELMLEQGKDAVRRVHEVPDADRLYGMKDFLHAFGLKLPETAITSSYQLSKLVKQAQELPYGDIVQDMILRSQKKARYSTDLEGHFGLALDNYAHFTSPIRRYADLLLHRSLVSAFNLAGNGLSEEQAKNLEEMASEVSECEKRSKDAERSTVDRLTAAFFASHVGEEYTGRIRSIVKSGLFVRLDGSGADVFINKKDLPQDKYTYKQNEFALVGRNHTYRMGGEMKVIIKNANMMTGSTNGKAANDNSADFEDINFDDPDTGDFDFGKPSAPPAPSL